MLSNYTRNSAMPSPVSDGVNRVNHPAQRAVCGIGFIILSREINKEEYVQKAYRNKVLTIMTDRNEIIKDCYVERNVWQYLNFPEDTKKKGSMVVWFNPPLSNKPIIVGVLSKRDELLDTEETNSFNLTRNTENSSVRIEGLGESGTLNINIDGETDDDSNLNIKLTNTFGEALMEMYVQGNINIESDNEINVKTKNKFSLKIVDESNSDKSNSITYELGRGLTISDEFKNTITLNNGGLHAKVESGDKITFEGEGNTIEPALLGTTTKALLNDLNNNLKQLTTAIQTAVGTGSFPAFAASLTPQLAPILTAIIKVTTDLETITAKNVEVS